MKPLYAILVMLVLCGCAKVSAQNGTVSMSGTTSSGVVLISAPCPSGQHYLPGPGMTCVPDDGKPPRWVPQNGNRVELEDESGNHLGSLGPEEPGRWVCDKGFELDGFTVTWPDGIAKISPARCIAKEKP